MMCLVNHSATVRLESAPLLLQGGSLTLARLTAIVPSSILADPAPLLYSSSM